MSNYVAGQVKEGDELKQVIERVNNEFKEIEKAFNSELRLPTLSEEPSRPRNGTIAYAEGTAWDPGSGEGIYAYFDGNWQKLEVGSFQTQDELLDEIAALPVDPGADSGLFFDDSTGQMAYWTPATPLAFSGTTLTVGDASTTATGVIEQAIDSEVRSAATGNLALTPALLESAAALVTLTETSGAVAVDWDTFINGTVTVDEATQISNPSNGQPGTWRTLLVQGNNTTDRTITFAGNFLGEVPTITDCDSGRWYLLSIYCVTTSHFTVSSKRAKG